MEYAEWLITSGLNDGETAEDVLLSAADALLEFDVGDGKLSAHSLSHTHAHTSTHTRV